jgi:NAD-dependent dihydropyrimidine dehydrogenase PreA subunit
MLIKPDVCILCKQCLPYCPMSCIYEGSDSMEIDQDECVECGICLRNANCPTDAFQEPELNMPRYVRKAFSDPFGKHENTEFKHTGRGTEEIKTNDVTGIVHSQDRVAVAIEMGRPSIGARFRDVEAITKVVSKFDIEFEKSNPVTSYIINKKTGQVDPQIINEKVLSCIIEFGASTDDLQQILYAVKEASRNLHTVFSVGVICKIDENNKTAVEDTLSKNGYDIHQASSKTNVGLGRPRYEDRVNGGLTI